MAPLFNEIETFNGTSALKFFRAAPRFGHTNDISTIASTTDEDSNDYERGVLFVPLFFLMLFLTWIIVIVTLKCTGPKNAGFLSGHSFTKEDSKRPLIVRIIFLFFSILLIIFSVLLIVKGCESLERTTNDFKSETMELIEVTDQILFYIKYIVGAGESLVPKLKELLLKLDPGIAFLTGFISPAIIAEIRVISDKVIQDVDYVVDNFIESTFSEIIVALENVSGNLDGVYTTTNDIDPDEWTTVITYSFIPVITSAGFLATGTIMELLPLPKTKFQSIFESFNTYVVFPLFATVLIFCAILVIFIGPAGTLNADVCSGNTEIGGPEGTILNVLKEQNVDENDRLYQLVAHYLTECATYFPFMEIQEYDAALDDARSSVDSYKILAETVYTELQLNDNYKFLMEKLSGQFQLPSDVNFAELPILLDNSIEEFDKLLNSTRRILDLISCENVSERYYRPMIHDVFCTQLISTLAWMFTSLLIIAISGFIMITLRAAWKQDKTVLNKSTGFEVVSPKIP